MSRGEVLYANSFDGGLSTQEGMQITATGGTATTTSTNARNSGRCLRLNRTSAATLRARTYNTLGSNIPPPWGGTKETNVTFGFYLFVATLPSATIEIFQAVTLAGSDGWLDLTSGGVLTCRYSAASSATVATLSAGTGYYIELNLDTRPAGPVVSARVNGGTAQTATSGTTAAINIDGFALGTSAATASTYDLYFDDLVCWEGPGFFGDHKVIPLRPDGDLDANYTLAGSVPAASRNASMNEVPSDDSTAYISSATLNQVQRCSLGTYTLVGSETVKAVSYAGIFGGSAATARQVDVALQTKDGYDSTATTMSCAFAAGTWVNQQTNPVPLTSPPRAAAWRQEDVDGLAVKFTITGSGLECRITQFYVLLVIGTDVGNQGINTAGEPPGIRRPQGFMRPTARGYIQPAQGTLFLQTMTASSTAAAVFVMRVNKILAASSTATPTLIKQANKILTVSSTATPTLIKQANKILTVSSTGTAVLAAMKVVLLTMSASATGTATLIKQANKILAASSTATPTLIKRANKILTVSSTGTAVLTAVKTVLLTLTAAATGTASLVKQARKTLGASSTATGALVRLVGKVVGSSSTATASLVKQANKIATASSTATAVFGPKVVGKVVAAASTATSVITTLVTVFGGTVNYLLNYRPLRARVRHKG